MLSRAKWLKIVDALEEELNQRLRNAGMKASSFKVDGTPVARLLGKEMLLLAWALEDADPTLASAAIQNWRGLSPEERWWLYTMTAAQTAHHSKRNVGWRKAVRYALTENPVVAMKSVTTAEHKRRSKAAEKQGVQGKLFGFEEPEAPFLALQSYGIWGETCPQPQEQKIPARKATSTKPTKASSKSSSRSRSSPKNATKKEKQTRAKP
jgi:hypothetical protein